MANSEEKKKTSPYISFSTMQTALDAVASAGVPNIIDRHSFPSLSGGAVAAILSAFRFFGLIDGDGAPEPFLHTLATAKDDRPANVKKLIEQHYDSILSLDLLRATPGQLDQAFSDAKYNVNGATKRKAQAFFLKAAAFAEIPIGKLLMSKSRNVSTARKPRKPKSTGGSTPANINAATTPAPPTGAAVKTITLSGGGSLTLSLNVNLLELKGTDRKFVFALIDSIEAYENPGESSPGEGVRE